MSVQQQTASHQKVFSILVSFYDEILKKVVIEHYESVECILVNSSTLLHKIDYLFKRDDIPWANLISDLSDNTNYMRGKKSGLETKLREKAPNMLDHWWRHLSCNTQRLEKILRSIFRLHGKGFR